MSASVACASLPISLFVGLANLITPIDVVEKNIINYLSDFCLHTESRIMAGEAGLISILLELVLASLVA